MKIWIILPINQKGDIEACNYNNGIVTTPNGFKNAYKNFIENGWQGIRVSEKYGGQNLPYFMNMFIDEMKHFIDQLQHPQLRVLL